jgi:hypothetical protein
VGCHHMPGAAMTACGKGGMGLRHVVVISLLLCCHWLLRADITSK